MYLYMSLFSNLKKELSDDLKLNQVVLSKKQEERPQILIKWLWRFAEIQKEMMLLEEERESLKRKLTADAIKASPVKIGKMQLNQIVESLDELKNFDKKLKDKKIELELIQESVKAVKDFSFDIGRLIEIIKLEKI